MTRVRHEFVEFIPAHLEAGVVYVSFEYTTVAHLCFCGCGNKVVNPLNPAQWRIEFDGETVSLHPSVGSWDLPCRSHYWITRGVVRWARAWSDEEIRRGRHQDRAALSRKYDDTSVGGDDSDPNVGFLRAWLARRR